VSFYCSTYDEKIKFVFEIYDFDGDGLITKSDVVTLINCMPVVKTTKLVGEGKFT
jgi:Ca2+-binding EF-hand superfamily protein